MGKYNLRIVTDWWNNEDGGYENDGFWQSIEWDGENEDTLKDIVAEIRGYELPDDVLVDYNYEIWSGDELIAYVHEEV